MAIDWPSFSLGCVAGQLVMLSALKSMVWILTRRRGGE
jgi:hypothetical protein